MTKIISFEGFEYSGKSTQINLLKKYFIKNHIKSEFTREPGGIKDLEKIRKVIVNSDFTNKSLILFFFASRFELISKIEKKNQNKLYVFDRYFDSTYAYQGINQNDKKIIKSLISLIDKKSIPEVTFYLDIDQKSLMERKKSRVFQNKFDEIYLNQFKRIKKNYNELLKLKIGKRKYIKINANRSPDIIHQEIISHLSKCKLI